MQVIPLSGTVKLEFGSVRYVATVHAKIRLQNSESYFPRNHHEGGDIMSKEKPSVEKQGDKTVVKDACIHANSYIQKSLNSQYANWLNTRELEFHENAGFSLTVKWRCNLDVI